MVGAARRAQLGGGGRPSLVRFMGSGALRSPTEGVNAREALLFTPGPLTTSPAVKQAMLVDLGSRDPQFISKVQTVREKILNAGGVSKADTKVSQALCRA